MGLLRPGILGDKLPAVGSPGLFQAFTRIALRSSPRQNTVRQKVVKTIGLSDKGKFFSTHNFCLFVNLWKISGGICMRSTSVGAVASSVILIVLLAFGFSWCCGQSSASCCLVQLCGSCGIGNDKSESLQRRREKILRNKIFPRCR